MSGHLNACCALYVFCFGCCCFWGPTEAIFIQAAASGNPIKVKIDGHCSRRWSEHHRVLAQPACSFYLVTIKCSEKASDEAEPHNSLGRGQEQSHQMTCTDFWFFLVFSCFLKCMSCHFVCEPFPLRGSQYRY